jgi:hypothetical protein
MMSAKIYSIHVKEPDLHYRKIAVSGFPSIPDTELPTTNDFSQPLPIGPANALT